MSLNNLSRYQFDFEYFQDRKTMIDLAMGGSNGNGYGYGNANITRFQNETQYQYQNELINYINQFEDSLSKVDMGGAFNKQRLKLTSDERGVFSFGSASKGLYNPQEFYSFLLAQELPNEFPDYLSGIVPPMLVRREMLLKFSPNSEYSYFYTSPTNGKTYQLVKQDEGTLAIDLGLRKNKVYKTTQKKCYMILPKKGGKAKMVDLYIPKNQGISLENMLPSFMLAYFLRLYGVMTRINVIRVFDNFNGGSTYTGYAFKVKDFGEDLDFNRLALEGADNRIWYLVRDCVGNLQNARKRGSLNYGNPQYFRNTRAVLNQAGDYPTGVDMTEYMGRFRNFYMEKMDRGEIDSIRIDKKLMLMGYSEGQSWDDINRKFYELLDVVDTQFNKVEEACKRIYKREVEDNKRMSSTEFKDYMVSVFNLSYSYPVDGEYAESDESQREIDAEYEEKLDGLSTFLQSVI